MQVLCELVTVFREQTAMMSLGDREGGRMRGSISQETCLLLYGKHSFHATSNWLYVFDREEIRPVV